MALTDESGNAGMVMPVAPMYGGYGNNGGFGGMNGDWAWLLLLLIAFGGGWGNGFGGGFCGGNIAADSAAMYPWFNQSNQINGGFRDQMLQTSITSVGDKVTSGFGDVALGIAGINQNICQTGNGIVSAVNGAQSAVTSQLYNNEIASLNRSFAEQQANQAGFTGVNSGIADLRYTEATEACATRTASAQNTRDIIDAQTRGTQAILDKLCALELDGVKSQLAAAQRENVGLQNQVNMATMAASQAAQTAAIQQGMNSEVDALYNRLKNCPVPTQPVYGNQPIFTCGGNNGCGCGCGM